MKGNERGLKKREERGGKEVRTSRGKVRKEGVKERNRGKR